MTSEDVKFRLDEAGKLLNSLISKRMLLIRPKSIHDQDPYIATIEVLHMRLERINQSAEDEEEAFATLKKELSEEFKKQRYLQHIMGTDKFMIHEQNYLNMMFSEEEISAREDAMKAFGWSW